MILQVNCTQEKHCVLRKLFCKLYVRGVVVRECRSGKYLGAIPNRTQDKHCVLHKLFCKLHVSRKLIATLALE